MKDHNRMRGEWMKTPFFLRLLGFRRLRRAIYAYDMIGGGIDGWEYFQTKARPANDFP